MELSYKEWQSRNTKLFTSLSQQQRQELRERGYHNISWKKVKSSWELLQKSIHTVTSIFDIHIQRGNITDAINISLLEVERFSKVAKASINELKQNSQKMTNRANKILDKYKVL